MILTGEEIEFCRFAKPQTYTRIAADLVDGMQVYFGQTAVVTAVDPDGYRLDVDGGRFLWKPGLLRICQH